MTERFRLLAARATRGLSSLLPGMRIGKTALAVAVAWWVGQSLGQPTPIFAALAALQAMRPTIAASIRHSGGQLLGMLAGTALALATSQVFAAPGPLEVGLGVLLAFLITVRLQVSALLGTEVAVTTLLAFALARGEAFWGLERLWEAAIGGGVAIAINVLVLPPDYLGQVRAALRSLTELIRRHTRQAVEDYLTQPPPEIIREHLVAARAAVRESGELVGEAGRAREALRFSPLLAKSPLRPGVVGRVERAAKGAEVLAAVLVHSRTALRATWQASRRGQEPPSDPAAWRSATEALETAIARYADYALTGTPASRELALAAVREARRRHATLLPKSGETIDVDRAALISELEHILDDLAAALEGEQKQPATAKEPAPMASGRSA